MSEDKYATEITSNGKIDDDPDDFIDETFSISYKKRKNNTTS